MPHSPTPSLSELTNELARSRQDVQRSLAELEAQLNVPRRLRDDIAAHPLKWALVTAALGFGALKLLPLVVRVATPVLASGLAKPLLHSAAAATLPLAWESLFRWLDKGQGAPTPPPLRELN
jgi:hypothetical protein